MTSKYDYSKPINLWLTSDSIEYEKLVTKLLDIIELKLRTSFGITRFRKQDHSKALFHILADLFVTYIADNKRYLAFSRDRVWYSKSTRYQPKDFAFKPFLRVVDALDSLGYIESTKGFQDPRTGKSRLARMIATEKLATLFSDHKLTPANFYQLHTKESILLKSPKDAQGNKQMLDYEDTPETQLMRENLKLINTNISNHWIDIKITDKQFSELQGKLYNKVTLAKVNFNRKSPIDFTRTNLVRIFNNGSFEDGGRFYRGWWQEILSDYRKYITIDGQDTIEIDYSAIHFYMMYAEQGLNIPQEDPYTFDGYNRKDIKIALNIAINAQSQNEGVIAINKEVWPDKKYSEVKSILELIIKRHKPIACYFFSGKGIRLQYLDSKVAELVMLNLLKINNIIALPVHDSFIVCKEHKPYLLHQMKKCFKEITKVSAKVTSSDDIDYTKIIKLLEEIDWANVSRQIRLEPEITTESLLSIELYSYDGYEKRKNQWEGVNIRN